VILNRAKKKRLAACKKRRKEEKSAKGQCQECSRSTDGLQVLKQHATSGFEKDYKDVKSAVFVLKEQKYKFIGKCNTKYVVE
jgi:hypothetical protein